MGKWWKQWGAWLLSALLAMLGLVVRQIPGFSFSGYVIWGLALLVLAFRVLRLPGRRWTKIARVLRVLLVIGLCIGTVAAAVTWWIIADAAKGDEAQACEYVIVLGAGVNGTKPSLILSERIQRAYEYMTAHPDAVCIVSGGQGPGEDMTEAQCMYDRLTEMGIDRTRIWKEEQSTSTRENLRFSLALIEDKAGSRPEKAAIISNEFHLYRADKFAAEQGLEMVGVPAKTTWVSLRINYYLREIVAVWYYMILGG